jgi:hypothetical protein
VAALREADEQKEEAEAEKQINDYDHGHRALESSTAIERSAAAGLRRAQANSLHSLQATSSEIWTPSASGPGAGVHMPRSKNTISLQPLAAGPNQAMLMSTTVPAPKRRGTIMDLNRLKPGFGKDKDGSSLAFTETNSAQAKADKRLASRAEGKRKVDIFRRIHDPHLVGTFEADMPGSPAYQMVWMAKDRAKVINACCFEPLNWACCCFTWPLILLFVGLGKFLACISCCCPFDCVRTSSASDEIHPFEVEEEEDYGDEYGEYADTEEDETHLAESEEAPQI